MPSPKKIIAKRPVITKLTKWLTNKRTEVPKKKYCHIFLQERPEIRTEIVQELADYFYSAHEPARRHRRALLTDSLHPFKNSKDDPAYGYPEALEEITLQGYFGEVLTGIIAENYTHFGSSKWQVPAYLFHTHDLAFHQLELARQTGKPVKKIPGRHGDDCLAFERDDDGSIRRIMFCESKCTQTHNASLIKENHEKLSFSNISPVDLLSVIEALKTFGEDPLAKDWIIALQLIALDRSLIEERCDLSSYICGQMPKKEPTWISQKDPHLNYTGGRSLEAVETHIEKVKELIGEIYSKVGSTIK